MSVGKSGPTTAPVGSQSKHLTTRQLICAQMVVQKQLCSPFCCVVAPVSKELPLGKSPSALCVTSFELHVEIPYNRRKECIR